MNDSFLEKVKEELETANLCIEGLERNLKACEQELELRDKALREARVALHTVVHGPEQAWNAWLSCRDDALRHINEVLK